MKLKFQFANYFSVFFRVFFGCLVMVPGSILIAQEQLRIDASTVKVVPSAWELMKIDSKASLRGLCVLDKDHVWASGSKGTVIQTSDGGATWTVRTIEGAEELDIRDIHAIDEGTIVAMTSGTPARIYRSTNGGISWKMCFESTDERVFLDALSFWNAQDGIVMGDPIESAVYLLGTTDGGRTWQTYRTAPNAMEGEAGFAASGTNAITLGNQKFFIGLGGAKENDSSKVSRILYSPDRGLKWYAAEAPFERTPSSGIFSICFSDEENGVAVGGDYKVLDSWENNFAFTHDGGKTWTTVDKEREPPSGFRSAVAVSRKGKEVRYVAVGPNGTDVSLDLGHHWRRISNEGFHAVAFTQDGVHGWASGADGRIGRWTNRFDAPLK